MEPIKYSRVSVVSSFT